METKNLFVIASWAKDGRSVCFWMGEQWGVDRKWISFFETRAAAALALAAIRVPIDEEMLLSVVMDVSKYNERYGKDLGVPEERAPAPPLRIDKKTGLPVRELGEA